MSGRLGPAQSVNEKFNAITVAFADGGKDLSARDIVQELWGPEAGGRDGIAGSPRGQEMSVQDLSDAINKVNSLLVEKNMEKDFVPSVLDVPDKDEQDKEAPDIDLDIDERDDGVDMVDDD